MSPAAVTAHQTSADLRAAAPAWGRCRLIPDRDRSPRTIFVGGDPRVIWTARALRTFLQALPAAFRARGFDRLAARVTAGDLPRAGRSRVWTDRIARGPAGIGTTVAATACHRARPAGQAMLAGMVAFTAPGIALCVRAPPLLRKQGAAMPKLDPAAVPVKTGSIYPSPYREMMAGRSSLRLGEAGGLTQFGVNLVTLEPGALSSLRHWHHHEDEFVWVTEGECTLIQDAGETVMRAGDCAAFPAGHPDGHHFRNHTGRVARFLVVGTKAPQETAVYSDIDMMVHLTPGEHGRAEFTYKDGTPWKGPR
jgi:uncharacterized cupin superfamily protein